MGRLSLMNVLLVFKKNFESIHDESLGRVKDAFLNHPNIRVDFKARESINRADFIGRDLVIVLGGDGTLTSISHNIDSETPVMGVNSHPRMEDVNGSFGFYLDSHVETFEQDLQQFVEGKAIINHLPRLQATIDTNSGNRIRTDPAMNDLLIANTHQYAPSKYRLRRGNFVIEQHSSGLIFSTWLGQGAWFNQAVKQLNLGNHEQSHDHYLVMARDIDPKTTGKAAMEWTRESTIITSDMHRGYVVPDGWDEYHFNRGASISIDLSGPTLKLITFRMTMVEKFNNLYSQK